MRGLALAVGLAGGAAAGDAAWSGAMQSRAGGAPDGWVIEDSRVPYRLSALSGPLALEPQAWGLDFWRAIHPAARDGTPAAIEATVRLPEGGQLELWPTADLGQGARTGVALVLERVGSPSSSVIQFSAGGRRQLSCEGALDPPDGSALSVRIAPSGDGVEASVGQSQARCRASLRGDGPALRPGLRRVLVQDLKVGGEAIDPPGPESRPLWAAVGGLLGLALALGELRFGAMPAAVAWTSAPLLLALLLGGRDTRLWAETARLGWLPVPWLAAGIPAALSVLAKTGLHLGRGLREHRRADMPNRDWPTPSVVAAGLPLVLAAANVPTEAPLLVVALSALGAMGALGLGVAAALRRLGSGRPNRAATWCVGSGCALGLALSQLPLAGRPALIGAVVAGTAASVLLWANVNATRVRALNAISLVCVALAMCGLEIAARYSPAGAAWSGTAGRLAPDDIYGWVPVAEGEFGALEDGTPSTYPDSGNPVAIPPKDGRFRIVAMGGSTTGGAFQNDDLDDFYPARMAELLGPDVAVLNQGVGGWTTWHIRQYLERNLEALAPDVLTLYVGHNDLLTPVPAPYSQLYADWRRPSWTRSILNGLGQSALYQGFRYLLVSFRPAGERVAVPLDEAEQNLRAIVDQVASRGGKVLLASEGLSPDPGPLQPYNQRMESLARERPEVVYLDVASLLHDGDPPALFLDDCHLTASGHALVAAAMVEAMRASGMIPEHAGP